MPYSIRCQCIPTSKTLDAGAFLSFPKPTRLLINRTLLGDGGAIADNYFAALIRRFFRPVAVQAPPQVSLELSTYFRINNVDSGQLSGPSSLLMKDLAQVTLRAAACNVKHQLHAAVVELVALDDEIKYSTVQNWFAEIETVRAVYNCNQAWCRGKRSKISWSQVETGSAIT